jgi:hypothetical protein
MTVPAPDLRLFCKDCKSFMLEFTKGHLCCPKSHGRLYPLASFEPPIDYERELRLYKIGAWLSSFPSAYEASGGWRIKGLLGIYKRCEQLEDNGVVADGIAARVVIQRDIPKPDEHRVYRFTKLPGDTFAATGYRAISRLRGSIKLWQGNQFSPASHLMCDEHLGLDTTYMAVPEIEKLRALGQGKRCLPVEQCEAIWAANAEVGQEMEFLGWLEEGDERWLHVLDASGGKHRLDADLAAYARTVLKPDDYRVTASGTLQYMRGGAVAGFLAGA